MKKPEAEKSGDPPFERRPESSDIGRDFQPKRDLTPFVTWPCDLQLWGKELMSLCSGSTSVIEARDHQLLGA